MADTTTTQIVREDPAIEAYKVGLLESAKDLAGKTYDLPTYQIAGEDPYQTKAIELASEGIGAYEPFLEQAVQTLTGDYGAAANLAAAGKGIAGLDLSGYMNPYMDAVRSEINRQYDTQQAQLAGQQMRTGAYGGSRAALAQSELDRNRGAALAKMQADAYTQAAAQAQADLNRQLQAGTAQGTLALQQAGLGESAQNLGQQEVSFLYDVGSKNQAQDQAVLEAKRMSDLQQLYQPYQNLAFLSDIYKGAPSTQMTLASSSAPQASPFQTYLGLGVGGLTAAAGAKKAGLF